VESDKEEEPDAMRELVTVTVNVLEDWTKNYSLSHPRSFAIQHEFLMLEVFFKGFGVELMSL